MEGSAGATSSDYKFRLLEPGDFQKGILTVLGQLTDVGGIQEDRFMAIYEVRMKAGGVYRTFVVEHVATGRVVGTATLLIEAKFTHGGSFVGHVEDVVVDKEHRGRRLAQRLLQECRDMAREAGCCKVLLDCNDGNVAFYEKCGYRRSERQMRLDVPAADPQAQSGAGPP